MPSSFRKVLGFDEGLEDTATLEQKLEREGRLWVVEQTVNVYIGDDTSFTPRDISGVGDILYRKLYNWNIPSTAYEARQLAQRLMSAKVRKNLKAQGWTK